MGEGTAVLERLAAADPEMAADVGDITGRHGPVTVERMALLLDETMWGLSLEVSFGRALAKGYARLIGPCSEKKIRFYRENVRKWGAHGPTVGKMMALHLVPVLAHGNWDLANRFSDVFDTMCHKGAYTLKGPLEGMSALLRAGETAAAMAYLDLLNAAFSQDINYNQSLRYTYMLPTAVASMAPMKRTWQIRELARAVAVEQSLAEAFLRGRERGLDLLSRKSLGDFVDLVLKKFQRAPDQGVKFMALDSSAALEKCREMQVAVTFSQVQQTLTAYVRARTGLGISIRPVSSLGAPVAGLAAGEHPPLDRPQCFSDTRFIYLPEEISVFPTPAENKMLYLALTKLEAGLFECGSHAFDVGKAMDLIAGMEGAGHLAAGEDGRGKADKGADLETFFGFFPDRFLAAALFTVFEHGRIRQRLTRQYPGMVKKVLPLFRKEAGRMHAAGEGDAVLLSLYHDIALGAETSLPSGGKYGPAATLAMARIRERFGDELERHPMVEASARLTVFAYGVLTEILKTETAIAGPELQKGARRLFPFGRQLRPDLVYNSFARYDCVSREIVAALRKKGLKAYKADVREKLIDNGGRISTADIERIVLVAGDVDGGGGQPADRQRLDLSGMDLSALLADSGLDTAPCTAIDGEACRHREWDCNMGDYLEDYVRVTDRRIDGRNGDFYAETLVRHAGLVKRMRHAFEMLRPEGLAILRQWVEGDEFDYRALLDFVLDRRAGIMPSDRLYIKRMKQLRDVAVLVLVDLSRSTANRAAGTERTVLDVEKAAIVLMCEALSIVGDRFAVAGYSGTGRFGVDYFRIKDFDEPIGPDIFENVNAMVARRSTRMGAAIRHATLQLEKIPARVRLLIAIGDGFPNDVGYKQGYAIADTRKAVQEAFSRNIVFRGISVNIAGDPRLDELYGPLNHMVITDVSELPDRLLRIYSAMTRS
ncbi:MAG: hypothetical protein LJE94_15785 [Deltaproteobacteria bacterium]|nr:hypothetical protein [Deltaproteobacteria bacterium]